MLCTFHLVSKFLGIYSTISKVSVCENSDKWILLTLSMILIVNPDTYAVTVSDKLTYLNRKSCGLQLGVRT